MRNTRPFKRNFLIYVHFRSEILLVQLFVHRAERFGGRALATLGHFVGGKFKLSEHGLTVQRAAELLEEVVDEVRALLLIGRDGQQVFHQQGLVAGGCNLSNKDNVILIRGRLGLVGQVRVDGVAHLMHKREHIVERALEVEQHIRVYARTCRVRARALALVLVHVDPTVCKAFAEQIQVVLTERRKRLQCDLLGLLEREFHFYAVHDRHIQVVHVQFVHAEQLLSQRNIAVHGRKRAVHRVD